MPLRVKLAVLFLVATALGAIFVKIRLLGPYLGAFLPEEHYTLLARIRLDGHGENVRVRMAVPVASARQSIRNELVSSGDFRFHMEPEGLNRWAVWERDAARGGFELVYSCTVRCEERRYELAPRLSLPAHYPQEAQAHLLPTGSIQSNAPEIRQLLERLVPPEERDNATAIVAAAFDYCHRRVRAAEVTGLTDALTCLRLEEGSCGGKSRLFSALLRAGGVPARIAGGFLLREGGWTSSHVWVDAWLGGVWVPFCPLNGYYAQVPSRYLLVYHGDEPLFSHTPDINFNYAFHGKGILAPPAMAGAPPPGIFNLWGVFEGVGIPVDLLKVILMIPFGALVVVVARNVVGLRTFGTFMPALMAVAFRDTGLAFGLVLFAVILAAGSILRLILQRFQLLHTPRLGVLLTGVVGAVILLALAGHARNEFLPTRVTLFPLVILTLTVERFAVLWEEDGPRAALGVTAATMAVVSAAYAALEWRSLQVAVLAFPETLLLAVAAFFILGRWTGIRLLEYFRFRDLLREGGRA